MQSAVFRRAFALIALILAPAALRAQETGKIEGRVVDQGGQPVVGAQVLVVGTRFGNITNPQGFYFINNVPAGLQDVQAQFIGYQTVTVRQQRVLAGQTVTLNFTLAQSAVAVQAIEVVGERTPLVPRDQVASKNIVTGELVQQLPADNIRKVLVLQPGVVETNRRSSGISIRGGRSGEEATFIDGVLVRNFGSGANHLTVGTNAVSEADVLTGGFSAMFGDAQSGVINLVTRSGGQRWTGAASVQTDEMMPKQYSLGLSRGEFSLGGPLIGNLSFFGAATAQGQRSINVGKLYRDLPIYVASGIDTTVTLATASGSVTGASDIREVAIPKYSLYSEGGRLPFSNADQYTLDGKLSYSYGSGSRIFLTGKASRQQFRQSPILGASGLQTEGVTTLYDPQGYGGTRQLANTMIFGITHNFVRSAEHELSLDLKLSLSNDELNAGALDHDWEVTHRDPKLGFTWSDFQLAVEADCGGRSSCREFPVNQELVHNMLTNSGRLAPFQQDASVRRTQEFRLNPYGVATGFPTAGFSTAGWTYQRERDKQARAAIDWQANRYNRIKFGGDYTDIDIRRADYNSLTDLSFARAYVENPKRISAFAQDRVDLGDVVIEAGVRWDRFDPNTDYPNIPGYYNPDDPATFTHIHPENAVSPRLGVSFPVTVNSTFRLSYGHFVQVPELNVYYRGKNTDFFRFKNTNTNDIFGRPLALGKTIAFEFGYRQLLAPDFVLDVTAYNKDKKADAALRKLPVNDPTNAGAINYLNTFTNADFGNIRGVDARLDRRFGQFLQAMLAYSYQDARNTGTDPFTYTALFARIEGNANQILGQPAAPPNSIRPTEENRKHNVTGTFAVTVPGSWEGAMAPVLHNVGLFGTLRFASGLPYTQVTDVGQTFVIGPPFALGNVGRLLNGDINTATTPWIKQVDLKLSKGFQVGGFKAQAFLDARNVFDFQNQNAVFLTTGGLGDEQVMESFIRSAQTSVGGGTIRDVDLHSLVAAGGGVTNAVNLIALRRTESLFGNGDLIFTQSEQAAAFRQATYISNDLATVVDPGRRLRLGIDLTF
jgi:hypothetical protein